MYELARRTFPKGHFSPDSSIDSLLEDIAAELGSKLADVEFCLQEVDACDLRYDKLIQASRQLVSAGRAPKYFVAALRDAEKFYEAKMKAEKIDEEVNFD